MRRQVMIATDGSRLLRLDEITAWWKHSRGARADETVVVVEIVEWGSSPYRMRWGGCLQNKVSLC